MCSKPIEAILTIEAFKVVRNFRVSSLEFLKLYVKVI